MNGPTHFTMTEKGRKEFSSEAEGRHFIEEQLCLGRVYRLRPIIQVWRLTISIKRPDGSLARKERTTCSKGIRTTAEDARQWALKKYGRTGMPGYTIEVEVV